MPNTAQKAIIFYDGGCGLCHGFVKFVMRRDEKAYRFQFSPLGGETFARQFSEAERKALPDSVVLRDEKGSVTTASDAVLTVFKKMGGGWSAAGRLLFVLPKPLRDAAYRAVARVRARLFKKPEGTCPMPAAPFRERFLR